ncbi:MAG: ABC transporter permease subunit [Deltaproteobacteria bacterium]|nr:ABC transporter permease subunit [Deltaproteobacteria bacterium]
MNYLVEGLRQAAQLILSFDAEIVTITLISLKISTLAIICASAIGVPVGFLIGVNTFKGRNSLITLLNTMMAFPTVVVGLLVYSIVSNQGPLGPLGLLFTPAAMVIGQVILSTPIVMALTISATQGVDPRIKKTAIVLGANVVQSGLAIVREARFAIMAAVVAGFGRVIGEVGASMMLGGNIRGYTRNIPTAIALETSKGEFGLGIALGIILLSVALVINFFMRFLQSSR